jgi:hypothetical protein
MAGTGYCHGERRRSQRRFSARSSRRTGFRLEKEIKNVVTVTAKTCHYWLEHMWAAASNVFSAGKTAPNMTSAKWREATQKARATCKAALTDLKRHQKEHGC